VLAKTVHFVSRKVQKKKYFEKKAGKITFSKQHSFSKQLTFIQNHAIFL